MSENEDMSLEGKTAIVAVEEEDACEYIEKIMKEGGLTVLKANDGQIALDLIKTRKPNVAVLDVGLPTVFGFDICSIVKKDEELEGVHIILMASVYDSAAYKRGPSSLYGADDYIERHHVQEDLVDKIKAVLSGVNYTSEKKEEEEFVPFGGDTDSSEGDISLGSADTGLPPLGAPAVDADASEETSSPAVESTEDTSLGSIPPLVTGGGSDGVSEDFAEPAETSTIADSSLELGGSDGSDAHFSEEGEATSVADSSLELGGSGAASEFSGEGEAPVIPPPAVAESPDPVVEDELAGIDESPAVEAPVIPPVETQAPLVEVPAPPVEPAQAPPVKKPYTLDEEKLGVNAKEILASDDNVEEKARKLARVVVSDIFLYNSEHVDVGIREGTFYKLIKEDLRDGIKYMKKKIPKHLPSDQILKDAFDEYILKRKEMMDKE